MAASLPTSLTGFFLRELRSLRLELEAFDHEDLIWSLPEGIPNSAGTLVLHLTGNLLHYIGRRLGNSSYVRDREAEFTLRNVPREKLLGLISEAEQVVRNVVPSLKPDDLDTLFQEPIRDGYIISVQDMLLQLAVHLSYHLGQLSYHRRIVTGNKTGVGALSVAELNSAQKVDPDE